MLRKALRSLIPRPLPPSQPADAPVSAGWSWWRRWVLAVLVVAVIGTVVVVLVSVFTGHHDDQTTAGGGSGSSVSATPAPGSTADTSAGAGEDSDPAYAPDTTDAFGRRVRVPRDTAGIALAQQPARDTDRPTAQPPVGMVWEKTFGVPMPYSVSDGPAAVTDGMATGFARTAQGSALAGWQILLRASVAPQAVRDKILADQVVGSDTAKSAFAAQAGTATAEQKNRIDVPFGVSVSDQYTPDFSSVQWASGPYAPVGVDPANARTDEQTASIDGPLTVVWDGGQWKLRIPDTGLPDGGTRDYTTVAGWATW
ncbi:hypothetical protein [Williamsia sterculiae]|uniref:DUF8175 domain-containing protein n=1 Tax=Williamsia sterculiae TaxID=1344003 RepID=A0A1N7HEV6_9NOCA|nr:hypothetical protein [Williamsia sterculiae]SIS23271.1 hypothetical protein SAMN05445060_4087 [Williamsia sterculiae]